MVMNYILTGINSLSLIWCINLQLTVSSILKVKGVFPIITHSKSGKSNGEQVSEEDEVEYNPLPLEGEPLTSDGSSRISTYK